MTGEEFSLAKVFRDAKAHLEIAGIIRKHLQDDIDIRSQALDGLDLSEAKNILDLGCGYGFFTEALKGRVHPEARVTGIDRFPEYEWFYFQSCDKAGIRADFRSDGIKAIEKLAGNSYDLILCSYAMYFFPEVVKQIARILKDHGHFIAITHALPHMPEFTSYVRSVVKRNGLIITIDLPYETLLGRFSDQNAPQLLQPWFNVIRKSDYKGRLLFAKDDHQDLISYFNFKHSFFIPQTIDPDDELHRKVVNTIKSDLRETQGMQITKNDSIFVCTQPVIADDHGK